jgi:hypothetical protein
MTFNLECPFAESSCAVPRHSKGKRAMDALLEHGQPITLDDLAAARRFTATLRDAEPDVLAPAFQPCVTNEPRVLTADKSIAEAWHEVAVWKRGNPPRRRGILFSVPVRY